MNETAKHERKPTFWDGFRDAMREDAQRMGWRSRRGVRTSPGRKR